MRFDEILAQKANKQLVEKGFRDQTSDVDLKLKPYSDMLRSFENELKQTSTKLNEFMGLIHGNIVETVTNLFKKFKRE